MTITFDIEASNLLNSETIDYTSSPYRLKDCFSIHCIVVEVHETGEIIAFYDGPKYELDGRAYKEKIDGQVYVLESYLAIEYTKKDLKDFPEFVREGKQHTVVGHNILDYDLLACKLWYGMDYNVKHNMWNGAPYKIEDTLVISKCLNPDRFGGHSLDSLGKKVGLHKIEFRKNVHESKRFLHFAADMLYYCIRDVQVNTKVYSLLQEEAKGWDWKDALELEHRVRDIITRGSHRGFRFNKDLAEECIEELDRLMQERRDRVTPLLPKKKATKKFMGDMTPPKNQFLKKGGVHKHLINFVAKHGGTVFEDERKVEIFGKMHDLPLPVEPLISEMDADINDTTHIKEWLVGLGWQPSEYKDKDLTVRQVKGVGKVKRTQEEYNKAVETYVEQTLESNFCNDRLEHLGCSRGQLKSVLLKKKIDRSVKVLSNPSFTRGQEKEMCPDLERVSENFPYAKDVVEYLTYKHRRNSILGGGLDWDDEEEAEKGYMANIREDGRISTPADSCGAGTSRFKHRVVANIPRITSLYGAKMRALFGVDSEFFQVGYDFSSLEARIESHYCWRWDKDKEYCKSLLLEKPNDVHSVMSRKISAIIGKPFDRSPAKNVKYGITYGSSEGKVAKIIGSDLKTGTQVFNAFWEAADPLNTLKNKLKHYWETVGGKKFILGIDGRKVPTRSAHAILNSLFQSGGVICAKRAMVVYEDLLEAEGLLVDFFRDDWRNKDFCQQLIAYHK